MQQISKPVRYIHEEDTHNLNSPTIIVPYLVDTFKPASVIDVGCGIGTFLHVFKEQGVKDVLGIDGKWVNKEQLYISNEEFLEANLEEPIKINRTCDLAICLEVAEHLEVAAADVIIDSLTSLSKTIVFSAATWKQGGQNHLNEQPFSYWKEKFEKRGFTLIDFFRPVFWNDERIQWWYKQNMFLAVHGSIDAKQFENRRQHFSENNLVIHPGLYYERIREYEKKSEDLKKLGAGEGGNFNLYLKLLYRSFKKSIRL